MVATPCFLFLSELFSFIQKWRFKDKVCFSGSASSSDEDGSSKSKSEKSESDSDSKSTTTNSSPTKGSKKNAKVSNSNGWIAQW